YGQQRKDAAIDQGAETSVGAILFAFLGVGQMNEVIAAQETADGMIRSGHQRTTLPRSRDMFRLALHGGKRKASPVISSKMPRHRIAQPDRLFEHRVENRSEIAGRRVDNLQDLCGRRLLRTGFRKLGGARLEVAPKLSDDPLEIAFGRRLAFHGPPSLPAARLNRGSTRRNSVNAPGSVSTSILPPCCLTMMSWLIDRPSPVPSPAGLVVKKGLNIFSRTTGGIPVPLSRIRISTRSPRLRVAAVRVG